MADWLKIKNEYASTNISYRKLAEKYGESFGTLRGRAEREGWSRLRKEQQHKISIKTAQKTAEKVADREADRIVKLLRIGDALAEKLEVAAGELDRQMITQKTKTKTTQYREGKATKEVVVEHTDIQTVSDVLVDRQGLRLLAATLKDLVDVANAGDESEKAIPITITLIDDYGDGANG